MEMGTYSLRKKVNLEDVLEMAECNKADKNYDAYKEELKILILKHLNVIEPVGYVVPQKIGDKIRINCLVSLGLGIDQAIAASFKAHDYLGGMMLNALADWMLFEATIHLYEEIGGDVKGTGKYLSARVEPGNGEVDMTVQKEIFDVVMQAYDLDMRITEGFMLAPTKSLCYYYEITEEDCSKGIDHDCSTCGSIVCKQRKYILKIHQGNTTELIQGRKGENLLKVLRHHSIYVDAPCNGKGICGKCMIKAPNHGYVLAPDEKKCLRRTEDAESNLLACFHTVDRDLDIHITTSPVDHEIEAGYQAFHVKEAKYDARAYMNETYPIGIGVDIGTTTLAVSLINLVTHEVLDIRKRINSQMAYGADVISRIMYVSEHGDGMLSKLIRWNIEEMVLDLIKGKGYSPVHIEEMVISGNTTMIYLFMMMDPAALAVAPFTTVDVQLKVIRSKELFEALSDFNVTILPWISAYVGGDIVSGIYATHLMDRSENIVFVDVGTNGEMVLCSKGRMLSAATAAGPAFEGTNIKCGMGSVSGAICEISADGDGYDLKTLGDAEPIGICGSALIDAVALLHKQGFVDDMGFMEAPVMFHGDIGIYPSDIRQVQLAKAAIMAGVDVLLDVAGLTYDDIDAFYMAGGFGSHLNVENSAYIGLIPKEIVDKVTLVGNTSLAGSVRYLLEKDGAEEIEAIRSGCEYIELSSNMKFNEAYVTGMTFGDFKW